MARLLMAPLAMGACSLPVLAEPDAQGLAAAIPQVEPVDPQQVLQAREQLREGLIALELRLSPGTANSDAWKEHLDWPTLLAFAEDDQKTSLAELQGPLLRLSSGHAGLEIEEFRHVARQTRRLFDLLQWSALKKPNEYFQAQAKLLVGRLGNDPRLLDPRGSFAVEQRLSLFAGLTGADAFAQRVLDRFAGDNVHATVSLDLLNHLADRTVTERRPVREVILGTNITGAGDTTGRLSLTARPSPDSALLHVSMAGNVQSSTLGVNGPACIRSSGSTVFTGGKSIALTREAFLSQPAEFDASTTSRTRSISKRGGGVGEKLVVAIARRKVAEQKACADSIAGGRAALRLEEAFDQRVEEELSQARQKFEQELLAPLERRGAGLRNLAFSTDSQSLGLAMRHAGRGQLAADTLPPLPPAGDLAMCVHQSGANNLADTLVGGATISKSAADEPAQLDIPLPGWASRLAERRREAAPPEDAEERFRPWRLTFRRARPISVRFDRGQIEVFLHAARLQAGEEELDKWDLILRFQPESTGQGLLLRRVGEVEVLPTGFDPAGRRRRLSSRQVAVRNNLQPILSEGLPAELPLKAIALRDGRGQLSLRHLQAADGWLTAVWDLD